MDCEPPGVVDAFSGASGIDGFSSWSEAYQLPISSARDSRIAKGVASVPPRNHSAASRLIKHNRQKNSQGRRAFKVFETLPISVLRRQRSAGFTLQQ